MVGLVALRLWVTGAVGAGRWGDWGMQILKSRVLAAGRPGVGARNAEQKVGRSLCSPPPFARGKVRFALSTKVFIRTSLCPPPSAMLSLTSGVRDILVPAGQSRTFESRSLHLPHAAPSKARAPWLAKFSTSTPLLGEVSDTNNSHTR